MPRAAMPPETLLARPTSTAGKTPTTAPKDLVSQERKKDIWTRMEPLRRKYTRYVIGRPPGLLMLSHPLLQTSIIDPDRCAAIHHDIERMSKLAAELLEHRNVYDFVFCHTRPFRIAAFRKALRKLGSKIKDEDYWKTLRALYEMSDSPSGHWHTFRRWFASRRKNREYLMELEERDLLRRLPDSFTVYRGYSRFDGVGMSWTLDRRVADWFAHSRPEFGPARVITGVVRRDEVLALLTTAGEAEVLVPNGLVTQRVHGPAVAGPVRFSVFEYAKPRFDIEALCVRDLTRPTPRHRPTKTDRKPPAPSKVRSR